MSKIKSALELALEKTASVKIDKEAVKKGEYTKKGKAAAGKFLSDPKNTKLPEELEKFSGDEQKWMKEGMIETLLANITLPRYETDLDKYPPVKNALMDLVQAGGKKGLRAGHEIKNMEYLLDQFSQLFSQYIQNLKQLEEQLTAQWEPRLRQKEQQLARETGQNVQLTADQDPEFSKVLSEELSRMDAQYAEILNQGKEEIRKFPG